MRKRTGVTRRTILLDLVEIKERCMAAKPVMIKDPETKELVPSGEWTFDVAGALKAIDKLERLISDEPSEKSETLSVEEKGEILREIVKDFSDDGK